MSNKANLTPQVLSCGTNEMFCMSYSTPRKKIEQWPEDEKNNTRLSRQKFVSRFSYFQMPNLRMNMLDKTRISTPILFQLLILLHPASQFHTSKNSRFQKLPTVDDIFMIIISYLQILQLEISNNRNF
jgi:hypothetical protein